ncbi:phosphopantetheine-binding protein [Streptomyces sp. NPDC007325]|uniref:phosphopantetheine-binding protein n=1 Tax=Streptomyces sp. NPDC007325 TaxID=3154588 RepID=UPI0033C75A2A
MNGRELLAACISAPAILDALTDDEDLREAGLNSGEIVLAVMRLEETIGRALDDDEITSVTTIASIDALLRTVGTSQGPVRDAA